MIASWFSDTTLPRLRAGLISAIYIGLVIDATPPADLDHWNFQLNNHWMESLDYRYFRIHVNSETATYNDDGSVRIVVAHEDPGHPNWLDTSGHEHGTMGLRWVRAIGHPEPTTRVVPLASLKQG